MIESKIIKVAECIFENHQKVSEAEISEKFGKKDFEQFRQVFGPDYAEYMDVNGKKIFRLTAKGAQLYLDLKGKEQQEFLNKLMVAATIALAVFTFIQVIKLFI